ncbi:MAG TPA: zinc protease, partial [Legionella sp.]|nr:zinc protease [Legionella sp.]
MKQKVDVSPVILIIALTTAVPIYAATPVALQGMPLKQLQQMFDVPLPGRPQARVASVDSLQFAGQHIDENNVKHVRMQQTYAGFPVFGGYAITHTPTTHQSLPSVSSARVNGMVYEDLAKELGQAHPLFIQRADLALQQFKAHYALLAAVSEEKVTPMVYVDEQQRAFWAYRVSVLVQPHDGIPERPTAIVDANTSNVFLQWNDVKTHQSLVKGQGYGGNARAGSYQFGLDFPFLEVSRDDMTGICYMQNDDVSVIDMDHGYSPVSVAMAFGCAAGPITENGPYWTGYRGDGYDLMNGAYSPTNDALYIGSVIKNMYSEWYGVNVLVGKTKPMKLVMRVHYGEGYENAFWDGQQMTF